MRKNDVISGEEIESILNRYPAESGMGNVLLKGIEDTSDYTHKEALGVWQAIKKIHREEGNLKQEKTLLSKGYRLLISAVDKGLPEAINELASLYRDGSYGVHQNQKKAIELFESIGNADGVESVQNTPKKRHRLATIQDSRAQVIKLTA